MNHIGKKRGECAWSELRGRAGVFIKKKKKTWLDKKNHKKNKPKPQKRCTTKNVNWCSVWNKPFCPLKRRGNFKPWLRSWNLKLLTKLSARCLLTMHISGYWQGGSRSVYESKNCNIRAEQPQPRLPHPKKSLGIQSSKWRIHNLPWVQMKKKKI